MPTYLGSNHRSFINWQKRSFSRYTPLKNLGQLPLDFRNQQGHAAGGEEKACCNWKLPCSLFVIKMKFSSLNSCLAIKSVLVRQRNIVYCPEMIKHVQTCTRHWMLHENVNLRKCSRIDHHKQREGWLSEYWEESPAQLD